MTRKFTVLILFVVAGLFAMAQEMIPVVDPVAASMSALRDGQIQTAETQWAAITNPAAKLFVQASIERVKGDSKRAIQTVAGLIVQYPNDPEWTAKSEMMSVVLYMDLGMLDAADVTARQMQIFYAGTAVADKASALRVKIEKIKEEIESKQEDKL